MAQDPKNYRDPKVTTESRSSSSSMQWVWIAAAVIVVLLLLAWAFGWMGTPRTGTATGPVGEPGVTQQQPLPGEGATGEAPIGGATTGDTATGPTDGVTVAPEQDTAQPADGGTADTVDITPPGEEPALGDDVEVETVPIQPAD